MIYFALSLLSVTIVFLIYLMKTKRWKHLGYFLLFVIVFSGVFIYALKARPYTLRGPEDMYQEIILALCAVAGLFTNPVLQRIKGRNFPIQWPQLTKAASIAPSIFLLFWGAVEEMAEITIITYCFAYANGYFWATILKKELRFDLKEFDADIRDRCLLPVVNADDPQDPKKVKAWDHATRTALTIIEDRVHKLTGIRVKFELTNKSFDKLSKDKCISKDIVNKLRVIKNQSFTNENDFLNAVTRQIGEEETIRHTKVILKYADIQNANSKGLFWLVFGKDGPWEDRFKNETDRNDHIHLYTSVFGILRNAYAHNLIDRSPEEAGSIVLFIDFLLKMLEGLHKGKKESSLDSNLSFHEG